jgi:dipeptidyl aminopeptidase/acylaminoacyl peptidase
MRRGSLLSLTAVCALLVGTACRRGSGEAPPAPSAVTAALDRSAILSDVPPEVAPVQPSPRVLGLHAATSSGREYFFSARGGGVAFVVEEPEGFHVVHNGVAGKRYAAVGTIALSPDGRRCAHGALVDGQWHMVVDGKEGEGFSAVKAPVFSPDGAHLAYQAMAGVLWHLVVDGLRNAGTRTRYLALEFGAGSRGLAFIDDADDQGTGRLVVSDLGFVTPIVVAPRVLGMTVSADASRLAAVAETADGRRVLSVAFDRPGQAEFGSAWEAVASLAFGPDGRSLAYVAERGGSSFLVLDGEEEPLPRGSTVIGSPVVRPAGKGVGALVATGGGVALLEFPGGDAAPRAAYAAAEGLAYSADGRSRAFAAQRGPASFVVVNGREGPPFDRVVSPLFSPDGERVVYRARQGGERFVVVADLEGRTVRRHAGYEQVFPVIFTADGRSLAYGVKDGVQLAWKVEEP